jgi:hypothetical protein
VKLFRNLIFLVPTLACIYALREEDAIVIALCGLIVAAASFVVRRAVFGVRARGQPTVPGHLLSPTGVRWLDNTDPVDRHSLGLTERGLEPERWINR